MSIEKSYGQGNPKITQYVESLFNPEDAILRDVHHRTHSNGLPPIQVSPLDGLHLEVITRAVGARKAVEIGTLAGYSGICILRGMQPGGKLFTFEYDSKHAAVARESFEKSGLAHAVQLFVGPALDYLPKIESEGPFDLVFIDADKENYPNYLHWAAQHLKVGGVVLADNTFGFGMIADSVISDPAEQAAVQALRKFNEACAKDGRFKATILPTGEGLTLAVKVS